jgi:hypothetical protein
VDVEKGRKYCGGEYGENNVTIAVTLAQKKKGMLGATPNHLTLSTASTLSAGSTGSAAKLIQASSTPGKLSSAPPPPEPSKSFL